MTFPVFISKHALTKGIREVQVTEAQEGVVIGPGGWSRYRGREWHRTREEAIARAEQMRVEKLKSLQKQARKLKGMEFK